MKEVTKMLYCALLVTKVIYQMKGKSQPKRERKKQNYWVLKSLWKRPQRQAIMSKLYSKRLPNRCLNFKTASQLLWIAKMQIVQTKINRESLIFLQQRSRNKALVSVST
ncbi:Vps63p [Saccharomyces cerevisiae S288C]|uniref:Uncharacterized protein VPS63 n=1 Tax=Saccharomyces cerevisiae (strain ATCC 204508 / S288c) TaxID=559292 RepID=VPS63_YEAST|eukprot:NP_013362.1 Vps63p [Saccharomyces cerevisiae S288C]